MNNKNIVILMIGILILAIAILVLIIFKGKEMKNWIKENILCCFGKKEVEEKPLSNDQTQQPRIPYTSEEDKRDLAIALKAIQDMKESTNEIGETLINLTNIQNQLFIEEAKEIQEKNQSQENSNSNLL